MCYINCGRHPPLIVRFRVVLGVVELNGAPLPCKNDNTEAINTEQLTQHALFCINNTKGLIDPRKCTRSQLRPFTLLKDFLQTVSNRRCLEGVDFCTSSRRIPILELSRYNDTRNLSNNNNQMFFKRRQYNCNRDSLISMAPAFM